MCSIRSGDGGDDGGGGGGDDDVDDVVNDGGGGFVLPVTDLPDRCVCYFSASFLFLLHNCVWKLVCVHVSLPKRNLQSLHMEVQRCRSLRVFAVR